MPKLRWIAGLGLGALGAAGVLLAPALQARGSDSRLMTAEISGGVRAVGGFTPAAADPKLAALIARTRFAESSFRFTPAEALGSAPARAVTMTARIRPADAGTAATTIGRSGRAAGPSFDVAPIRYNLGNTDGFARFAAPAEVAKLDLGAKAAPVAGDLGLDSSVKRPVAVAPVAGVSERTRLTAEKPSEMLEVGGSFALTRNLDVTAGLRYKAERDRLRMPEMNDARRDSQAVYVGTAFRF